MVSAAAISPGRRWSRRRRRADAKSANGINTRDSECELPRELRCRRLAELTRLSKHAADDLRHLGCRKGPQRFGANIAERTEAQRERHEGWLIWRIEDGH